MREVFLKAFILESHRGHIELDIFLKSSIVVSCATIFFIQKNSLKNLLNILQLRQLLEFLVQITYLKLRQTMQ
jgi:hypothetical protein